MGHDKTVQIMEWEMVVPMQTEQSEEQEENAHTGTDAMEAQTS
jgi:hypothetical protein